MSNKSFQTFFSWTIFFLTVWNNYTFGTNQTSLAQSSNPIPTLQPQEIIPSNSSPIPEPKIPSLTPATPEELLPFSSPNQVTPNETNLADTLINVKKIEFDKKTVTVFTPERLKEIKVLKSQKTIGEINHQQLSYNQLVEIATKVAEFYAQEGYQTSGAVAVISPEEIEKRDQNPHAEVIVTIKVLEGILEKINLTEKNTKYEGRLGNYIRYRLGVEVNRPLNVNNLLQSLQLLQIDPLIQNINAKLTTGSDRNKSILSVEYIPANSFNPKISLDNSRPPSIGTVQREIELREDNLTGLGDTISISYKNTDGSNRIDTRYTVPITPENGTIGFIYTWSDNDVIQDPFFDIDRDGNGPDIESNYNAYDFNIKQPIIRTINEQTFEELILALTASWRETQSFLLDMGFPLSPGADAQGISRVFALRFAQEYTQQKPTEVIAFRSEFNFGLEAFNATSNEQVSGGEELPDSSFFAWRGQAQYVKLFAPDTLFLARSNIQLSSEALLPIEQFSLGGFATVRGYRQDLLLTDNGWGVSVEFRYPILQLFEGEGVLQIIPFFDYGLGWNSSNVPNPNPQNLASLGVGLQWRYKSNFIAKIESGIPLISVDTDKNTLQENGIYFSIQYFPFTNK